MLVFTSCQDLHLTRQGAEPITGSRRSVPHAKAFRGKWTISFHFTLEIIPVHQGTQGKETSWRFQDLFEDVGKTFHTTAPLSSPTLLSSTSRIQLILRNPFVGCRAFILNHICVPASYFQKANPQSHMCNYWSQPKRFLFWHDSIFTTNPWEGRGYGTLLSVSGDLSYRKVTNGGWSHRSPLHAIQALAYSERSWKETKDIL